MRDKLFALWWLFFGGVLYVEWVLLLYYLVVMRSPFLLLVAWIGFLPVSLLVLTIVYFWSD